MTKATGKGNISASTATQTSSSSTATSSPTLAAAGRGGLSSGAKAGIGVSVLVAVLGIIGGLLCYYWHRRRQKKLPSELPPMSEAPATGNHTRAYATIPTTLTSQDQIATMTTTTTVPQSRQHIPIASLSQPLLRYENSPPQQQTYPPSHLTQPIPVEYMYPYSSMMQPTSTIPQPYPTPIPVSQPTSIEQPYERSISQTPPNAYPAKPLPPLPTTSPRLSVATKAFPHNPYSAPPPIAAAAAHSGSTRYSSSLPNISDPTSMTSLLSPVSPEGSPERRRSSRPDFVTRSSEKAPEVTTTELTPSPQGLAPPPLHRSNPSENAPIVASPPAHSYPEVVSTGFPFPPHPSVRPSGRDARRPASPTGQTAWPEEPDEELRRIRTEQARLRERRNTLTQLALLDEEDVRLQRDLDVRLAELGRRKGCGN